MNKRRRQILDRDGWVCRYCGDALDDKGTMDHVIPLSRGGASSLKNLVACCERCNSRKGNRTAREFGVDIRGEYKSEAVDQIPVEEYLEEEVQLKTRLFSEQDYQEYLEAINAEAASKEKP